MNCRRRRVPKYCGYTLAPPSAATTIRFRYWARLCAFGALAPLSSPSVLRSSSTSGQWIPYPPPAIFQFLRCVGVALSRRGYQTRGTLMTRPSRSDTLSASSLNATSSTRSSVVIAEEPIPRLQEKRPVLCHHRLYCAEFVCAKSEIRCELDRIEPEFRRQIVAVDMNVRRLVRLVTVEVETVRARPQHRRHGPDSNKILRYGTPTIFKESRGRELPLHITAPPSQSLRATPHTARRRDGTRPPSPLDQAVPA